MSNFEFTDVVLNMIKRLDTEEHDSINQTVNLMVDTIMNGRSLFIFGASHAGILMEEAFYRAGGLVLFNPIFARNLMLDTSPISMTSAMERLDGYGKILVEKSQIKKGDVVVVHSVSGRNSVTVELAEEAKLRGAKIIAITSLAYSSKVKSRAKSNKLLYEVADIVIDNQGIFGDAAITIGNTNLKTGSTSTVVGATIINILASETIKRLDQLGVEYPPVFASANIDGNDDKNKKVKELYAKQIHYDL